MTTTWPRSVGLGFHIACPEAELRETIAAWSEYIDGLTHDAERDQRFRPLIASTLLRRAVAFFTLKEYETAIADLQRVISGQDLYGIELVRSSRMVLGGIYCELRQDGQAIECWSEVLTGLEHASRKESKPYTEVQAQLYLYRSMLQGRAGNYQEALADCDRAAKLLPEWAEAWSVRGLTYANGGELDRGLADCQHAIELDAEDSVHYSRLAEVYLLRREYALALNILERAAALDPANTQIQVQQSKARMLWLWDFWENELSTAGEQEENTPPIANEERPGQGQIDASLPLIDVKERNDGDGTS